MTNKTAVFGLLFAFMFTTLTCSKKDLTTPDPDQNGGTSVYRIEGTGKITVSDSVTGSDFVFPNGGIGELTVTRLAERLVPTEPYGSKGYIIGYTAEDSIRIVLPRSEDSVNMVAVWDKADFSFQNGETADSIWMPLPLLDTADAKDLFALDYPGYKSMAKSAAKSSSKRPLKTYYAMFSRAKAIGTVQAKIDTLAKIAKKIISDVIDSMPTTLGGIASTRVSGVYALDGIPGSYSGWSTYYRPWSYSERLLGWVAPYFVFKCYGGYPSEATPAAAAHEVGHYMSHVMLGDDFYADKMLPQAQGTHDLGDPRPGRPMVEEYAHFIDWFTHGNLANRYTIEEVNTFFRDKRSEIDKISRGMVHPDLYDWPGMEGFGCALLARMTTSKNTISSHTGDMTDTLPVLLIPMPDLMQIVYTNAMDSVNDLARALINYVESNGGDNKYRMPALMERLGWSYNGEFIVMDRNGKPVENAKVQNISQVKPGEEYRTPYLITETAGKVHLSRLFPLTSIMRVFHRYNATTLKWEDSTDFPLTLAIERPTNKALAPDTLTIDGAKPVITSISPVLPIPCQYVAISGSGFGEDSLVATVTFNNAVATRITTWSDSYIGVYLPAAASSGLVIVKVGSLQSDPFNYVIKDSTRITSIIPSRAYSGDTIAILGRGLKGVSSIVYFEFLNDTTSSCGNYSDSISWSDTLVRVRVNASARTGTVRLFGATGFSNRVPFTVLMPYSQYPGLTFNISFQGSFVKNDTIQPVSGWDLSSLTASIPVTDTQSGAIAAHWDSSFTDASAGTVVKFTHDVACSVDVDRSCLRKVTITSANETTYSESKYRNKYDTLTMDSLPMYRGVSDQWQFRVLDSVACSLVKKTGHYEETNYTASGAVSWTKLTAVSCVSYSMAEIKFVKKP